jgi:perosamine synthetase
MARIHAFIARKREIAQQYAQALAGVPGITLPVERANCTNVYWMYSILVERPYPLSRDELIPALRSQGIDSRPFFHPIDTLPPYRAAEPLPVSLRLSQCGLNLPSAPALTDEQVQRVCDAIVGSL